MNMNKLFNADTGHSAFKGSTWVGVGWVGLTVFSSQTGFVIEKLKFIKDAYFG